MKKLLIILLSINSIVFAANTPCSGKKGGVDHCNGSKFVCKDGSYSASKKICSGYGNTKAQTKTKATKSTSTNSGAGSAFNPDASN